MKINKTTPLIVLVLIISLACAFPILGPQGINVDSEVERKRATQTALALTMTPTRRDKSGIPTNTKEPTLDKSGFPTNTKPPTTNPSANPTNTQPPTPTPTKTFFIPPPVVNPPEFPAFATATPTRTRTPTPTNTQYVPTVSFTASNPSVFKCGGTQYVEVHINNNSNVPLKFANMIIIFHPNNSGMGTSSATPFHRTSHDCGPGNSTLGPGVNTHVRIKPWRDLRAGSHRSYDLELTLYTEEWWVGDYDYGSYTIFGFVYNP